VPDGSPADLAVPLVTTAAIIVCSADFTSSGTHGKTGTAEYGTGEKLNSHAWFMGFKGDVAFAVVVEGGGGGGAVAAPVAATFLKNL
jgi:cell division protein FtsI/penicillin-binding protein 2